MVINYPSYTTGDLIEVVKAPDQSSFEKALVGKFGLIIENIYSPISPNLWKVLIEDRLYILHAYDIRIIQ